jgi:hypothetical protein
MQDISNTFWLLRFWKKLKPTASQIHSMKSKIKTKLLALAISLLMLASVLAVPNYNYQFPLDLQDAQEFGSAFVDSLSLGNWAGVDGGPEMPTGSSFSINASTGLELTSSSPYPTVAGYVWKYLLPLDSDWEVEVQAHMADFTPSFMQSPLSPEPFYHAGLNILFAGNTTIDAVQAFSNRLNWSFFRSLGANGTLENTLQEGPYLVGYGSTGPVAVTSSEDVVLTLRYTSSNRSLTTLWHTLNGTDTAISIYTVDQWTTGGNPPAYAALALSASSKPLSDVAQYDSSENYSLNPGLVYLKKLNISSALSEDLVPFSSVINSGIVSSSSGVGPTMIVKTKKKFGKGKAALAKKSAGKKKSEGNKSSGSKKFGGKKSGSKKPKKK